VGEVRGVRAGCCAQEEGALGGRFGGEKDGGDIGIEGKRFAPAG